MDDKSNLFGLYSVENDTKSEESLFEELSRFVTGTPTISSASTVETSQNALHVSLEERVESYLKQSQDALLRYSLRPKKKGEKGNHIFFLEGWSEARRAQTPHQGPFQASGGLFFAWESTGIVINPGREFLDRFHKAGYTIRDIDHVIITENNEEHTRDLLAIYELNLKTNKAAETTHFIQYTLERAVHENYAPYLKPIYKQERDMVRVFDLFLDSTNGETLELSSHAHLRYVPSKHDGALHLFFDLFRPVGDPLSLTYLSSAPYSEKLKEMCRGTDVLVASFGHTSAYDIGKVELLSHSLGYFGSLTLAENAQPKLMLLADFAGTEGDIRIEVTKKMRSDLFQSGKGKTSILPVSTGLEIDLGTLDVTCGITGLPLHRDEVKILKSNSAFAPLSFISDTFLV